MGKACARRACIGKRSHKTGHAPTHPPTHPPGANQPPPRTREGQQVRLPPAGALLQGKGAGGGGQQARGQQAQHLPGAGGTARRAGMAWYAQRRSSRCCRRPHPHDRHKVQQKCFGAHVRVLVFGRVGGGAKRGTRGLHAKAALRSGKPHGVAAARRADAPTHSAAGPGSGNLRRAPPTACGISHPPAWARRCRAGQRPAAPGPAGCSSATSSARRRPARPPHRGRRRRWRGAASECRPATPLLPPLWRPCPAAWAPAQGCPRGGSPPAPRSGRSAFPPFGEQFQEGFARRFTL